jgi:streptogramin lyase
MRKIASGLASTGVIVLECSTPDPSSSGSGNLPRGGRRPYDVVLDKNENAWTGSMITDQVTRLDTKTGEMVDYLLPKSTNIRRVFVDNTTTPPSFWIGSNHGASIIKVEPLD